MKWTLRDKINIVDILPAKGSMFNMKKDQEIMKRIEAKFKPKINSSA